MEERIIDRWFFVLFTIVGISLSFFTFLLLFPDYLSKPIESPIHYSDYIVDLSSSSGYILEDFKPNQDTFDIKTKVDQPLLEDSNEDVLGEDMPWFYYSPNVAIVSPSSLANRYPVKSRELLNDFTLRKNAEGSFLFQFNEPFTGWHDQGKGLTYYKKGREIRTFKQGNTRASDWQAYGNWIRRLLPFPRERYFFVKSQQSYSQQYNSFDIKYGIVYKNPQEIILSAPPTTFGSKVRSTTQNYVEMPLDVIEEVTTDNEVWLHVKVGYNDLGWLKKDDSYQDYVLTYYSETTLLDKIQETLNAYIPYISANTGASFVNNDSMAQVSVNNQIFFPASTQKIYVLGEVYHQYKTGELVPESVYYTTWDDIVPGAGTLQGFPAGSAFSIDYLVNQVVSISDNTAANSLIEAVGGGNRITPHMHQLGLYDTYVNGKYYHRDTNGLFQTTPADAARYFALLYNSQVNGEPYDDQLILKLMQNSHTYIRTYIPVRSWNKSGSGEMEQNDVATFVTPYGSYSLAVYTNYPWNYMAVGEQMATLSLAVYNTFNDYRSLLWQPVEDPESYMADLIYEQKQAQMEEESLKDEEVE